MTSFDYTGILTQAVDELSDSQSYKGLSTVIPLLIT